MNIFSFRDRLIADYAPHGDGDKIQELFRELVQDERRNALIEADIVSALKAGRRCLVLSRWKEHCRRIAEGLERQGKNVFMLVGGQGKKERAGIVPRRSKTSCWWPRDNIWARASTAPR